MNQSGIVYQVLTIGFVENDFNLVTKTTVSLSTKFELPPLRDSALSIENDCHFLYLGKSSPKNSGVLVSTIAHGIVRAHTVFVRRARSTDRYRKWKCFTENYKLDCTLPNTVTSITFISKIFFLVFYRYRLIRLQAESQSLFSQYLVPVLAAI